MVMDMYTIQVIALRSKSALETLVQVHQELIDSD